MLLGEVGLILWIFIAVFFAVGLIGVISPRASWYLSNWWRVQDDAEPSRVSLYLYRISGVLFLIVAAVLVYTVYIKQ